MTAVLPPSPVISWLSWVLWRLRLLLPSSGASYPSSQRLRCGRRRQLSQVSPLALCDDLWVAPLGRVQTRLVCRRERLVSTPLTSAFVGYFRLWERYTVNLSYLSAHGVPCGDDYLLTVSSVTTRQTELPCVTQCHLWLADQFGRGSFLPLSALSRQLFHLWLLPPEATPVAMPPLGEGASLTSLRLLLTLLTTNFLSYTVRLRCSINIPGARMPTLLPNCFCQPL